MPRAMRMTRSRRAQQLYFVALYETRYEPLQAVLDPAAEYDFAVCNGAPRNQVGDPVMMLRRPAALGSLTMETAAPQTATRAWTGLTQPQVKALLRPIVADLQELFERIPAGEREMALGNYIGTSELPPNPKRRTACTSPRVVYVCVRGPGIAGAHRGHCANDGDHHERVALHSALPGAAPLTLRPCMCPRSIRRGAGSAFDQTRYCTITGTLSRTVGFDVNKGPCNVFSSLDIARS